jgi:hypothetical protein
MVTIRSTSLRLESPARPDRARTSFEKGRDFTLDAAGNEGARPKNPLLFNGLIQLMVSRAGFLPLSPDGCVSTVK